MARLRDRLSFARLRDGLRRVLSEGTTPAGIGWAVGVGVFVGTTPLYGLHAPLCLLLAALLKLNPVVTVVASGYSIPPLFPVLVLGSVQLGNLALHGKTLPVSLDTFDTLDPYRFGVSWALGSLVLGALLGTSLGSAALGVARVYQRRAPDRVAGDGQPAHRPGGDG